VQRCAAREIEPQSAMPDTGVTKATAATSRRSYTFADYRVRCFVFMPLD